MLDHPVVVTIARIGGLSVVLFFLIFWFRFNAIYLYVLLALAGGLAALYAIAYVHHEFVRPEP